MSILEEIKKSTFIDELELRFLNNNDIPDLKKLCTEWFPLRFVNYELYIDQDLLSFINS